MQVKELKCEIAGLNVSVKTLAQDSRLSVVTQSYLKDFTGNPHITTGFSQEFYEKRIEETPHISLADCEHIWTGYAFAKKLLDFNGFVLHASAVSYKGKAYLFSAPSGTGKSTHTSIWQKVFGSEAVIINDDKPALRLIDGKLWVFGTPWSGKSDKNENICIPLGGICFISRSEVNQIQKADKLWAISNLVSQSFRYPSREYMEALLGFLDKNLSNIPVFKMGCNTSNEAATVAYEYMNKHLKGPDFYEN